MVDTSAKEPSIPLPESIIKAFQEQQQGKLLLLGAEKTLKDYYGEEINSFEGVLPDKEKKDYTSILSKFYQLVFDSGLLQSIIFRQEGGEPIFLLNRSSWIDQIIRKGGENLGNLQAILMFDIANLNGANKIAVANGDLLLNKAGKVLLEKIVDLQNRHPGYFFIPCRYGGDEFSLAIIKDPNFSEKKSTISYQQLLEEIKNRFLQEEHYYLNQENQAEEVRKITLKESETKVILLPQDPLKREIFVWALEHGIVISEEEILLFMNFFSNSQEKIRKYLEESKKIPFDYNLDDLFLMHELVGKHPELAGPLYLANVLDQKEGGTNKRLTSLLRLVYNALFDRLLGDWVLGFEDFKTHLERGEFKGGVIGIEMKFIKEINDSYSMVVADQVIKELYKLIIEKIPESERNKVKIFRRGGSFFIGLKERTEQVISGVTSLSLNIEEIFGYKLTKGLTIPLGFFYDPELQLIGLSEFIEKADEDWYKKVGNQHPQLIELIKKGGLQIPQIQKEDLIKNLTIENLLALFFTSKKRGDERREKLQKVLFEE